MKYNKFLTILFASGLLGIAVACTDNFEADNRNNTGFDSELDFYSLDIQLLVHYARSTEVRTNQRRAACTVSCNPNIEG